MDVIFQIGIRLNNDTKVDNDDAAKWISKQLAEALNIYTIPMGSNYGFICNKETYTKYYGDSI